MIMAKPILLIGIPLNLCEEDMKTRFSCSKCIKDEYHYISYPVGGNDFMFDVICEKGFDDIKYKELKELIASELEK